MNLLHLLFSYFFIFFFGVSFKNSNEVSKDSSDGGFYCPGYCELYDDGCNLFNCSTHEQITTRECVTTGTASCLECKSNREWYNCVSPCRVTCENYDNLVCTRMCTNEYQCACPPEYPIWKHGQCINSTQCDDDSSIGNSNLTNQPCPDKCSIYSPDGCNECFCNENGLTSNCTDHQCFVYHDPYCVECESNLVWRDCVLPCNKTCDNYDTLVCALVCTNTYQCACPTSKSIYENDTCINESQCPNYQPTTTTRPPRNIPRFPFQPKRKNGN